MINITNETIQNIPCHIGRIHSIAYDGCEFSLLTHSQKGVLKLDQALCPIKTIPTCRKYRHLAYCQQSRTYWAMCEQHPCTIFMLDENFCEIDAIQLPSKSPKHLQAISCLNDTDELLILYADAIAHVDIYNKGYLLTPLRNKERHPFDILSLKHGYVLAYAQDHHFFIEVNCHDFGEPAHFCIPDGFYVEGMYVCNYHPTSPKDFIYEINLLLCDAQSHQQYIMPMQIHGCKENHPSVETPCTEPCSCDEVMTDKELCDCDTECIAPCDCDDCCECDGNTPSCHQGVNEILHSIALEEAGLAHILNAEGEKIQKAIAGDITIDELLKVNESVSNTISKITILEVQLIAKLESVLCFCEDIDEDECPPNPPCEPCH